MIGMLFESTARLFLGEKAYQIAGLSTVHTERKKWLTKLNKKIIKTIDSIDTTERHKQMLMSEADSISSSINKSKEPNWETIYHFYALVGRLLGFDYVRGSKLQELTYHQSKAQHYTSVIFAGGDTMQDYYDGKDAVSLRKVVAKDLKEKGLNTFKIALVLNTSEYKIKQLLKD